MFYLSRLESGASGTVRLEVKLDGETLGNDYQNKLARLEMQFAAEEAAPDKIVKPQKPGQNIDIVKTGDNTEVMLYVSLMALAAGVILFVLVLRRMRSAQEDSAANAGRTHQSRGRRRDR